MTSAGPLTSSVPGSVDTAAARSAVEVPAGGAFLSAHGSAKTPIGFASQKSNDAPCGVTPASLTKALSKKKPILLCQPDVGSVTENRMPFLVMECLPAARSPSGGKAASVGDGEAAGDGLGDGEGDGATVGAPPTSPPSERGNRLIPTIATTTRAAAAIANFATEFMSANLHAGHQDRRCRVAGTWSSTASRTRSGSAVTPSSNHDRTMRVVSRSERIR